MNYAVLATGLSKHFGKFRAVDNISFGVGKGEVYGFLGANGAGKTTTIRMLCGLLAPTSGDAVVAGYSITKQPEEVKKRLGYMSQKFSLYGFMTPAENIEFYAGIYGVDENKIKQRTELITGMLELKEVSDRRVSEISGGIRQRVALACAIAHEPEILFLDEPTAGVDPILRRRFWEIIDGLSKSGTTVFVTTHYMDEVENCGRISLMDAGKIIAEGPIKEIKAKVFSKPVYELETEDIVKAYNAVHSKMGGMAEISMHGAMLHVVPETSIEEAGALIKKTLAECGIKSGDFRQSAPTMDDVFVKLVRK